MKIAQHNKRFTTITLNIAYNMPHATPTTVFATKNKYESDVGGTDCVGKRIAKNKIN